ncbi:MAG: hemolysin family protein [Spirochaetia bacterium]
MTVFIIPFCFLTAAFFSGLETGLIAADQFLLFSKKEKGVRYASAAAFLLLKPERLLSTTLIGTNISVVTAAVLLNSSLRAAGYGWFSGISSIILSIALLIFAEIIPKSFFRIKTDILGVKLAPALVFFYYLFLPVSFILNLFVKFFLLITGQHKSSKKILDTRQDLKLLVRLGSREAGIPGRDQRIIEDIFDFQETTAREVMIQLHKTPVCSIDGSLQSVVNYSAVYGMEYIPVYQGRVDNIIGYIDIEDIYGSLSRTETAEAGKSGIANLIREPVYYPDSKNIPDLLLEMNQKRLDLVFIVDEYGRVTGMLTPEEIVSEIVGFRPGRGRGSEELIILTAADTYRVKGITDIEDFQNKTGLHLKPVNADTLGGYLSAVLGRIPRTDEEYREGNVRYKILKGSPVQAELIEVNVNIEG